MLWYSLTVIYTKTIRVDGECRKDNGVENSCHDIDSTSTGLILVIVKHLLAGYYVFRL